MYEEFNRLLRTGAGVASTRKRDRCQVGVHVEN